VGYKRSPPAATVHDEDSVQPPDFALVEPS